jgi:uncharacterized protein
MKILPNPNLILKLLVFIVFYQVPRLGLSNNFDDFNLLIQGSNQIAGTLTVPSQRKTTVLVIMISGSGPQDRDETLDGFRIFGAISSDFASKGIATFRFDDRGVNESTGNFQQSTFEDHVNDIERIIDFFKTHDKHRFDNFVLLGHSQGGIVSTRVALERNEVKKLVLMGAPSVPLIDIVLYQLRQQYTSANLDKRLIESEVSSHNRLMRAIHDGKKLKSVLIALKKSHEAILKSTLLSNSSNSLLIKEKAEDMAKELEIIYALPALTSFLYHDTSQEYEQLKIPVLSLFGGMDLQVTISQNKDRMENAFLKGGVNYNFVTFNSANHYFQKARTGKRDEYAKLEKKFVDGFLDSISSWIIE